MKSDVGYGRNSNQENLSIREHVRGDGFIALHKPLIALSMHAYNVFIKLETSIQVC
jgi:hypothetical protein